MAIHLVRDTAHTFASSGSSENRLLSRALYPVDFIMTVTMEQSQVCVGVVVMLAIAVVDFKMILCREA
jgi:hypothetical protein